ncbi:MAG: hypothetical protein JOY55_20245 [Mycobacterium sp.]|jgi:hypothetical protein|nr:hypothetical protein [Mycobacterium sp.]MBV8294097.1 hypothetical protein [Mycobacterium sp.]
MAQPDDYCCYKCGQPIRDGDDAFICFLGTAEGKYIRITRQCLSCGRPGEAAVT